MALSPSSPASAVAGPPDSGALSAPLLLAEAALPASAVADAPPSPAVASAPALDSADAETLPPLAQRAAGERWRSQPLWLKDFRRRVLG